MPLPIEDYALLGDCTTAALVGRDGSVDWLCWPRFDGAACFAALLGTPEHGRWLLAPAEDGPPAKRSYRGDSLVLDTVFERDGGAVQVTDFMVPGRRHSSLVRLVRRAARAGADAHGTQDALRLRSERALGAPAGGRARRHLAHRRAGARRAARLRAAARRGQDDGGRVRCRGGQANPGSCSATARATSRRRLPSLPTRPCARPSATGIIGPTDASSRARMPTCSSAA